MIIWRIQFLLNPPQIFLSVPAKNSKNLAKNSYKLLKKFFIKIEILEDTICF